MENNIKTTLHVEFYGLPGSGKSTVSHIIADNLRNDGYKVMEPTYDLAHKHSIIIRKLKKILISFVFIINHPKKYKELYKLTKINGYKGLNIMRQIINIIPKINIYIKEKKGYLYIWDEGLIQSSISITKNIEINENIEDLFKIINYNLNDIIGIYINVSPKTAMERMNLRKTNDSRVEKLNNNKEKEKLLNAIKINCEKIHIAEKIKINCEKNEINKVIKKIYSEIR